MEAHIEKEEGRRFGDIEFPENVLDDSRFDSCNYFLHNHKDETDVRFLNWTEFVFVKFQDFAATKRFVSLSYAMFYVPNKGRRGSGCRTCLGKYEREQRNRNSVSYRMN
jgi:hypothetical protein